MNNHTHNPKLGELYTLLKDNGGNVGENVDEFAQHMKDANKRQQVYHLITKHGAQVGDFDQFSHTIGYGKPLVLRPEESEADKWMHRATPPANQSVVRPILSPEYETHTDTAGKRIFTPKPTLVPSEDRPALPKRVVQDHFTGLTHDWDAPETQALVAEHTQRKNDYGNRPQPAPTEPEPVDGLWEGIKQGADSMWQGTKFVVGKAANLFADSSEDALIGMSQLRSYQAQGKDPFAEAKASVERYHAKLSELQRATFGTPGYVTELSKEEEQQYRKDKAIMDALRQSGGDQYKAIDLLHQKSQDKTWGDEVRLDAARELAKHRPTEGWGWVGELIPQMAGSAAAIGAAAITRSPQVGMAIGSAATGAQMLSAMGSSMAEAHRAGATDVQEWKAGLVDGAIEMVSEQIPLGRYVGRLGGKMASDVTSRLAREASAQGAQPLITEMNRLLQRGGRELGRKLLNGKTAKELVQDIITEAGSEFTAEFLQSYSPIIYKHKDEMPTLYEALQNGLEGAKAGLLMGGVSGALSHGVRHVQEDRRRRAQGGVTLAEIPGADGQEESRVVEVLGIAPDDRSSIMVQTPEGDVEQVGMDQVSLSGHFTYDEWQRGTWSYKQQQATEELAPITHQDQGRVILARRSGHDTPQAIISGHVSRHADGSIDRATSSQSIVVFNEQEGKNEMISIDELEAIEGEFSPEEWAAAQSNPQPSEVAPGTPSEGMPERPTDAVQDTSPEASQDYHMDGYYDLDLPNGQRIRGQFIQVNEDGQIEIFSETPVQMGNGRTAQIISLAPEAFQSGVRGYYPPIQEDEDAAHEAEAQPSAAPTAEAEPESEAPRTDATALHDSTAEAAPTESPFIGRSMTRDEASTFVAHMEAHAEPARELDLTIENWDAEFGQNGEVETPIGMVKMGDNQFTKMTRASRDSKLGMVKPTLTNPDVIIEDHREAEEGISERPTSYVFVKSFVRKNGARHYFFTSVTVSKDGREVVISSEERRANRISKLLNSGKVAWINDNASSYPYTRVEESVPLNDSNRSTDTDNQSAWHGIHSPVVSDDKGNEVSPSSAIPRDEHGEPMYESVDAETAWDGLVELSDGDVDGDQADSEQSSVVGRSMTETEAETFIASINEQNPSIAPQVNLTEETWNDVFGENKRVPTPIGEVKMGENQLAKLFLKKREGEFGMIYPTLTEPDVIIEERSGDDLDKIERPSSYLFVKSFLSHSGEKIRFFASVSVQQDGLEIVVSNHHLNKNKLLTKLRGERILYVNEALLPNSSDRHLAENRDGLPDLLPTQGSNASLSNDKGNEVSPSSAIPRDEHGEPMYESVDAETAWDGLVDLSDGDVDVASEVASLMIEQKRSELEQLKQRPKTTPTGTPNQIAEAVKARKAEMAKAEADLAHWETIAGVHQSRIAASEQAEAVDGGTDMDTRVAASEQTVNTEPTEEQKKAGNYRKGHLRLDGLAITIEQPKGSVRSGVDGDGNAWSTTMNHTYGHIRGTKGKDGDHIDIFLSDNLESWNGDVYIVDQVDSHGAFDEHKVMYGFNSLEEAKSAYLSNYSDDWQGLGNITAVSKDEFKKWLRSSKKKTKPFSEYKIASRVTTREVSETEGGGPFGARTETFRGNPQGAATWLQDNQGGEAVGVFTHTDLGDISLIWGDERGGLSHIIKRHIEEQNDFASVDDAVAAIDDVVANGAFSRENADKVVIDYNGYRVVINKQTRDQDGSVISTGNWVVTAFDRSRNKKEKASSGKTLTTPPSNPGADGVTLPSNDASSSSGKGSKKGKRVSASASTPGQTTEVGEAQRAESSEIQPIGQGEFGNIYDQFRGKPKEAIAFLLERQEGEALGALSHPEVGEISLVWGNQKAGLQKIARKHPEVLDDMQDILDGLEIVEESDNRIKLENATHFAVVSKEYRGTPREHWLLTAYAKKEASIPANSSMDVDSNPEGKLDDTATQQKSDASERKSSEKRTSGGYAREDIKAKGDAIARQIEAIERGEYFPEGADDLRAAWDKYQEAKLRKESGSIRSHEFSEIEWEWEDMANRYVRPLRATLSSLSLPLFDDYASWRAQHGAELAESPQKGAGVDGTVWGMVGKDPKRPIFHGVHHQGGYAVGSDGAILLGDKTAYDKSHEGKTVAPKTGAYIDGKYPDWQAVIPDGTATTAAIDPSKLSGQLRTARAAALSLYKGVTPASKRADLVGMSPVGLLLSDGRIVYYPLQALERLSSSGERLSFDRISVYGDGRLLSKSEQGIFMSMPLNMSSVTGDIVGYVDLSGGAHREFQIEQSERSRTESEASKLATEAVLEALSGAGIEVIQATEAEVEAVLGGSASAELSRGQKRALDTAEQSRETTIATAVSSADGAKVLQNIDTAISEYEHKGNTTKTFIGDVANALGINQPERSSKYATFETANGKIVTIRVSNHNAKVSNFDNAGEEHGISIVITRKPNSKVANDGQAHIQEYFYQEQRLNRADGKPLAEILKGIKQALYSGEYKDTTGLAEYQEVNAGEVEFMRTPQGVVYGWTEGGKIYLTEAGMQAETPIHEYTHIWAHAMQQGNPEGWQSIKDLLRGTPVWDEVLSDPNYQHLADNEDAVASEALSRFSGREGRAKMEEMAQQTLDDAKGAIDKIEAGSVLARMRDALNKFWRWVGKALFDIKRFDSIEEVADRVLYDLVQGTDLSKIDPNRRAEAKMLSVPSKTDSKLKVSSLPLDTELPVVQIEGGDSVDISDALETIKALPASVETLDGVRLGVSKKTRQKLRNLTMSSNATPAYTQAITHIEEIIGSSVLLEEHRDRHKVDGVRKAENPSDNNIAKTQRFYGAVSIGGVVYRAKTTAVVYRQGGNRMHSYEVTEIELLAPNSTPAPAKGQTVAPTNNSISLAKLVENVELSYEGGKLLSDAMREANVSHVEMQIKGHDYTEEMAQIKRAAEANGTYMQAPNGKATNLNERQWLQVRTKAFKGWFGDWEKATRIEKLRAAEPVVLTGNEYEGKYELNRDSAKQWLKASLRGTYTIADTDEQVEISKVGIGKVTSHSMGNEAHLKSLVAIPQLIEHAIFVEEVENVKGNDKYDSYRYYVLGLQIDGVDYTVKLTIGVKQGKKYYDHTLTQIEKGRLIDLENQPARSFTTAGDAPSQPNALSDVKDRRLLSILQTDASKVVDENGEPMVVYHGTTSGRTAVAFTEFSREKSPDGFWFSTSRNVASWFAGTHGESVLSPYPVPSEDADIDEMVRWYTHHEGDAHIAYVGGRYRLIHQYGSSPLETSLEEARTKLHRKIVGLDEMLDERGRGGGIYSSFLNIRNPEVVDAQGAGFYAIPYAGDVYAAVSIANHAEAIGRDALHIARVKETTVKTEISDVYVVYSPEQIKSATNNVGTFDGGNADVRYRRRQSAERRGKDSPRAIAERVEELGRALGVPVRIVSDRSTLPMERRGAKGWFDPRTSEVVVVLENHSHVADAEATVYHEVVGHKGLRELVGEEAFEAFLHDIYKSLPQGVRSRITMRLAVGDVRSLSESIEEYLAEFAEQGFAKERSLWRKIVDKVRELVRSYINPNLLVTENDIRYLLWKAYHQRRQAAQGQRTIIEEVLSQGEDIAKRNELGIGLQDRELELVNARFNEELERLTEENADSMVLDLGVPSPILLSSGLPNKPLRLFGNKLLNKSKKHGFSLNEVQDLPKALANPIFVFRGNRGDNFAILTELNVGGNNVLVSIEPNKEGAVEFNLITSVFGKGDKGVINWINNEKLLYAQKEKALEYIGFFAPIANAQYSQELSDATKVVGGFENPKLHSYSDDSAIRYRRGDAPQVEAQRGVAGSARAEYEYRTRNFGDEQRQGEENYLGNLAERSTEGYVDYMHPAKIFRDAILKEDGGELQDYEDFYTAENHLSSRNQGETSIYHRDYIAPLQEVIASIVGRGVSYEDVKNYLIAKHGLERNEHMSREAARKAAGEEAARKAGADRKDAEAARKAAESAWDGSYTITDFSGLRSLTGSKDHFTQLAEELVRAFESKVDRQLVDALWGRINAATGATLDKGIQSHIITKSQADQWRSTYQHYIPLRGWAEDATAEEMWNYKGAGKHKQGNHLGKSATGRASVADDPIATIAFMGEGVIRQGNRNLVKNRLLNFVLNHPTDLVTVSRAWYVKQDDGSWLKEAPNLEGATSEQEYIERVNAFEARMQQLKQQGRARTRAPKGTSRVKVDARISPTELEQHAVRVLRGGEEHIIYINGNPRAAQAINGLLDEVDNNSWFSKANNLLARTLTSSNPTFILKNGVMDTIGASVSLSIKEDSDYVKEFARVARNPFRTAALIRKLNAGTLDMNNELERYFDEFIRYGGETGHTQIHSVRDYKRSIERFVRDHQEAANLLQGAGRSAGSALRMVRDGVEFANRTAEVNTRFATYVASRRAGRSVQRSVHDAKEVTVNFNRKGSGAMGARYFRQLYIFFNASVQAMRQLKELRDANPKRFYAFGAGIASLGVAIPLVNLFLMALLGGDDEEEYYWAMNEYTRRSNILIYAGNGRFIKIPLPHMLRPLYGAGENILSFAMGRQNFGDTLQRVAGGFSDLLPVDPAGGNGGNVFINLMPSHTQPIAQMVGNIDYFGQSIWRETDRNKHDPEWTKAKDANPGLVDATRRLNELSGGDDYASGWLDLNPEMIEHLIEGYTGGVGKFVNQVVRTVTSPWQDDALELRHIPFAGTFLGDSPYGRHGRLSPQYWELRDKMAEVERIGRSYASEVANPVDPERAARYQKHLNQLLQSPEFVVYATKGHNVHLLYQYYRAYKTAPEGSEQRQRIGEAMHELERATIDGGKRLEDMLPASWVR